MRKHLEETSIPSVSGSTREDRLAYLSDMIRELTVMSRQLGCTTLYGLLEVAAREAEIQSRMR